MKNIFKILIALALLIVSLMMSLKVYSLLTDSKLIDDKITFKSGEIEFELLGSVNEYIQPGINIINEDDDFKLKSKTNFDVKVRITIKFYIDDVEVSSVDAIEELQIDENWEYDSDDGYYYYIGNNGIVKYDDVIDIIDLIILDGHYVKNEFSDKSFKIEYTLEVIQADHGATWELLEQD